MRPSCSCPATSSLMGSGEHSSPGLGQALCSALVPNVTEAGNLLGVSRSTAYELVRTGELQAVQLRRRVVVPVAAVADRLGTTAGDVWGALQTGVVA
jgi:excisionase family DNA binding protein